MMIQLVKDRAKLSKLRMDGDFRVINPAWQINFMLKLWTIIAGDWPTVDVLKAEDWLRISTFEHFRQLRLALVRNPQTLLAAIAVVSASPDAAVIHEESKEWATTAKRMVDTV